MVTPWQRNEAAVTCGIVITSAVHLGARNLLFGGSEKSRSLAA